MKPKILVIEDNTEDCELLSDLLQKEFSLIFAHTGSNGIQLAVQEEPDIVLLDLTLPDIDGLILCNTLKKKEEARHIPIFILSARHKVEDKVEALESGAEDYLNKPFSPKELITRIKVILRRSAAPIDQKIQAGMLTLDFSTYEVRVNNELINLTPKEFDLLYVLLKKKGRPLTRPFLMERVWGYDSFYNSRTVDVHIRRLRQKLGVAGDMIKTVSSLGYRWEADRE